MLLDFTASANKYKFLPGGMQRSISDNDFSVALVEGSQVGFTPAIEQSQTFVAELSKTAVGHKKRPHPVKG